MSMTWHTFRFDESQMMTWLSSPITSTWDRSNCTMWTTYFLGSTFNFTQTVLGRMLDEAPESTKQLCRFLLKTSKVERNGGIMDLDIPLIIAISVELVLSNEVVGGLPISWAACEITLAGRGEVGTTFNSLSNSFYWCFNLLSSWNVIFTLVFFISSTLLYSISSETSMVLAEGEEFDWGGVVWVDLGEYFLPFFIFGSWSWCFQFWICLWQIYSASTPTCDR